MNRRRDEAVKVFRDEKYPFLTPEKRNRSTVHQTVSSPIVQDLLKKCKYLEELLNKSRNVIEEKEDKIRMLLQMIHHRDTCMKDLQVQNHKLLEERQLLIDHINQMEQEEDLASNQSYQHQMNLNDLRYFLSQVRQNEDIPIFMDVDHLSYEQLLQLEDTIGYVNRGLTDEQIKSIPKILFEEFSTDETICSVCQCEFSPEDKCKVLECNHIYHSKCIKVWLKKEKHCPICKQELFQS